MKKFLLIAIILSFFSFLMHSQDNDKIIFKWSFFKKTKNGTIESVDFSKDVSFNKDEKLKITVSPIQNAYFYIYYVDNNNDLTVLFPETFDSEYKMNKIYNIPINNDEWFAFDEQKGIDRFYLLVSISRQNNLEKLTKEYLKISSVKKPDADKLNKAKKELIDEILNLRSNYSKFKVFAEKPTSIAGVSRGVAGDKETMTYVEANKFYGKIFRINH